MHKVTEDKKVPNLITKLSSKVLNVFNEMPTEEALKYAEFKNAVFQRFQIYS